MSDKEKSSAPASKGSRFIKLASMTASVASNYASTRLKNAFQSAEAATRDRMAAHQLNGERIAQTLGELKGAAMKIGQMASIGSDVLPKELSDALVKLQKQAPPVEFDVIAGQIERELGAPPQMLFARFDEKPFASASIGQVHRAMTDDGREVVVKVQYPGVDDSVDSDLSHLKLALRASGLINAAHRKALNRLFEEVRARLHEELDYTNEAMMVRKFRDHHAGHEKIVVPDVVGERSSKRVLTLTFEPSDSISQMDELDYSQELRNELGFRLFDAVLSQIYELRAVQADPNPANFGFRKDGSVVLYDFGCVKEIRRDVLQSYRELTRAAIDEDYDAGERCLIALGARNLDGPEVPDGYYKTWRDILIAPLIQGGAYDFGNTDMYDRIMKEAKEFIVKYSGAFQPPVELVFIDRAIAGTFGNVRAMRTIADPAPLVAKYIRSTPAGLIRD